MARPNDKYEDMARKAADRIAAQRDLAEQLTLLPDEAGETPDSGRAGAGDQGPRRARGPGRAMNQMRQWLAQRGLRLPEDVLADMAGLASSDDAIITAMRNAERVLAWGQDGAARVPGAPDGPTLAKRLDVFMQIFSVQLRAAEALLPYGLSKATPDVTNTTQVTQIVVQGAQPAAPARVELARDITPGSRRIAPPPMPHQIEQNQHVAETLRDALRADVRTDGATDGND